MIGGEPQTNEESECLPWHHPLGPGPSRAELVLLLTTSYNKSRLSSSASTGTPTLIPRYTPVSPLLSTAMRCSSLRCSALTPFASSACDVLRFSDMPSTPKRSCSHSVNVVYMCVFITLHKAARSGPLIYHSFYATAMDPQFVRLIHDSASDKTRQRETFSVCFLLRLTDSPPPSPSSPISLLGWFYRINPISVPVPSVPTLDLDLSHCLILLTRRSRLAVDLRAQAHALVYMSFLHIHCT